jgi:integrase
VQIEGNVRRRSVSGHIYVKSRVKGPIWYMRVRLPHGGEERKMIGPVWTGTGRTPDGYFTKRTAQAVLDARLTDLRRGVGIPSRTGVTFRDAAEHWYLHRGQQEGWKPSTKRDYRSALDRHLLPAFGEWRLEDVTTQAIESWRAAGLAQRAKKGDKETKKEGITERTAAKLVTIIGGVYEQARRTYKLTAPNPARDVSRIRLRYNPEQFAFYTPEEVHALVRAAENPVSEEPLTDEAVAAAAQDGAIFLTAAFTGCRLGEVLALRVRDVDFEAESVRVFGSVDIKEGVGTPKSGKGRTVPMVPDVAQTLARVLQRDRFSTPDDFVFVGVDGRYLDGSALRRRYRAAQKTAKLQPIRFHDLRHTFGSLAITQAESVRELQDWMGHADARTTARYVHYKPRKSEARRLGEAFRVEQPEDVPEIAEPVEGLVPATSKRTRRPG